MMKIQETEKAGRNHYSAEFKQQALLRAVKDGVVVAAHDLGLSCTLGEPESNSKA